LKYIEYYGVSKFRVGRLVDCYMKKPGGREKEGASVPETEPISKKIDKPTQEQ
jgi:hypothetical protein